MTFKNQSKWALVLDFIPLILVITIFIWRLLDHLKNFEMIGRLQKQTVSNPTNVNFSKPNSSLYHIEASSVDITASKSVDSAETFYSKFCSLNSVWWYSNILTTSGNTVCLLTTINQFWRVPLENTYWGGPTWRMERYSESPMFTSRATSRSLFCLRNGKFLPQCIENVNTESVSLNMKAVPSPWK